MSAGEQGVGRASARHEPMADPGQAKAQPADRPVASPHRRSLLAKAHIGKQAMGLSDMEWVVYLRDMTGKSSSRELNDDGLKTLIKGMAARGVVFTVPDRVKAQRPKALGSTSPRAAQLKKIEALLADRRLPWAYAHAIARRMYRKDRVEFCDKDELTAVITALTRRRVTAAGVSG